VPELPEIETLRQDLEHEVVGRKVKAVEVKAARTVRRHRNRREFADRLVGRKLTAAGRRGSSLALALDSDELLVIHLGARGMLRKERSSAAAERHTDAAVSLATGGDLRVLGLGDDGELFVAAKAELEEPAAGQLAPIDPLTGAFTWQGFNARLLSRHAPLRALLNDESFVAGIGPVYADEILWASGLRWDRGSATLSAQEVRRLYRAIQEVLQEAVRDRGTSVGDHPYLDLHGKPGQFQAHLSVHGRQGQPCRRCRTPLACQPLERGATFYCPKCQS
jgi:formamidopyrimidine-DNA glycosylase